MNRSLRCALRNYCTIVIVALPVFGIIHQANATPASYSGDAVQYSNYSARTKNCPLNACEVLVYITQNYLDNAQLEHHRRKQAAGRPAFGHTSPGDAADSARPKISGHMLDVLALERVVESRVRAVERRLRSVEQPGKTKNDMLVSPYGTAITDYAILHSVAFGRGQRDRMESLHGGSMSLLGGDEESELLEQWSAVGATVANGAYGHAFDVIYELCTEEFRFLHQ